MNQSKKQSWADRIKKRNKLGFSLVELIVVIAIMAIMTAVLAPSLLSYVERSRAQKDDSAMSEVVNSIQLALADQNVYDEVLCYTCDNIKSCYVDKANPLDTNRVETKNYGSTAGTYENGDHYIYNDNERLADESGYVFHGLMRGVTITFEPERSSNKTAFVLYNGYINAAGHATGTGLNYLYGSCPETEKTSADMVTNGYTENMMLLGNMHSFSAPNHNYLYNRIRAIVGDRIELTSQTYRNSCYTIFIRMGTTGGNQADNQDAIMVYGQWGGTNLTASAKGQGAGVELTEPISDIVFNGNVSGKDSFLCERGDYVYTYTKIGEVRTIEELSTAKYTIKSTELIFVGEAETKECSFVIGDENTGIMQVSPSCSIIGNGELWFIVCYDSGEIDLGGTLIAPPSTGIYLMTECRETQFNLVSIAADYVEIKFAS